MEGAEAKEAEVDEVLEDRHHTLRREINQGDLNTENYLTRPLLRSRPKRMYNISVLPIFTRSARLEDQMEAAEEGSASRVLVVHMLRVSNRETLQLV